MLSSACVHSSYPFVVQSSAAFALAQGALHAGHASLAAQSRKENTHTVSRTLLNDIAWRAQPLTAGTMTHTCAEIAPLRARPLG
jgi:hypothetical protein